MKGKTKFLLTILFVLGAFVLFGSTNVYAKDINNLPIGGESEGKKVYEFTSSYDMTNSNEYKFSVDKRNDKSVLSGFSFIGTDGSLFNYSYEYVENSNQVNITLKPKAALDVGEYNFSMQYTDKYPVIVEVFGSPVESESITKCSFDVKIVVTKKSAVLVSNIEDNQMFVYDGSPKTLTGSVTVQNSSATVITQYKGVGTTTYDSTIPPTNAGMYTANYSLGNNYSSNTFSYAFMILKDTPQYDIPTNLQGVKGQKLSDVTLPTGFTWDSPNTELVLGKKTYTATYTPPDTNNYNSVNNISIEVDTKDFVSLTTSVNGTGGTISSSEYNIEKGSSKIVTFTPDTGYMIDKVKVNGIETTITNNKLELELYENKEVEVTYKKIPFTITVEDVEGVTISPNGTVNVSYGDDKEFTITVNRGYKLKKVLVNDIDKMTEIVNNKLIFNDIKSNITIEVDAEKIVYKVINGANQEYTISIGKEATFRIDVEYNLFRTNGKVYVDDILVDEENYTSKSGSTIIILKQTYLDTLSVGGHVLKVIFSDGGESTTNFVIARIAEEHLIDDKADEIQSTSNNDLNNSIIFNNKTNISKNNPIIFNNKTNTSDNNPNNPTIFNNKTNMSNKEYQGLTPNPSDNIIIYILITIMLVLGVIAIVRKIKARIK